MERKKNLHVESENLAVPEVRIGEEDEANIDYEKDETYIDFSGAIPEIHIKHKEK